MKILFQNIGQAWEGIEARNNSENEAPIRKTSNKEFSSILQELHSKRTEAEVINAIVVPSMNLYLLMETGLIQGSVQPELRKGQPAAQSSTSPALVDTLLPALTLRSFPQWKHVPGHPEPTFILDAEKCLSYEEGKARVLMHLCPVHSSHGSPAWMQAVLCENPIFAIIPWMGASQSQAPSSASTQTTLSSSWLPHLHRPPSLAPGMSTAKGQPIRSHIHLFSITVVFVSSFEGKSTLFHCRNS